MHMPMLCSVYYNNDVPPFSLVHFHEAIFDILFQVPSPDYSKYGYKACDLSRITFTY